MLRNYCKSIFIGIVMLSILTACSSTVKVEEERDKEAEAYFMEQLSKEIGTSDTLETNLTSFSIFEWDTVCLTYDKHDEVIIMFIKRGFLIDKKVYLDLSEYLDMAEIHKNLISEVSIKKGHKNIMTLCTNNGRRFIISRVKNEDNKYIIDTTHIKKYREEKKNEK